VLGLAGLAPWPITVEGTFVVAPAASAALVAPDSGVVVEVPVREGDRVAPGATVAIVRNLELERAAAAAARAVDSLRAREAQARASGRNGEAARLAAYRSGEESRLKGLTDRARAMVVRAPAAAVVISTRPETLVGRSVSVGDTLLRIAGVRGAEARLALTGAGASLARAGQRARLIAYADPGLRMEAPVASTAEAASADGSLESRVVLPAGLGLRPGMTGDARVLLREATVWEAVWWAVRSRIRSDLWL
jgi:cobalt-zinc-cadmium efflux system membrane fusion protein